MEKYKQVILVRQDLKLPKGKLAAQVAHASVEAALKSNNTKAWRQEGMAKIVLKVENLNDLFTKIQNAKDDGLTTSIITDAGHTVVAPGTTTCGAIGPDKIEKIDEITNNLKLM